MCPCRRSAQGSIPGGASPEEEKRKKNAAPLSSQKRIEQAMGMPSRRHDEYSDSRFANTLGIPKTTIEQLFKQRQGETDPLVVQTLHENASFIK